MENFILYEELGVGSSSVVRKGRKKGTFSYVAIICADKAKRLLFTNHVRLSKDLNHPNIVCFYEWYETSNHLWMVVELCTGGSLQYIIGQDGCLREDVVGKFGWDLVKGLKYIHELGIILSDLSPAKILLDGSHSLKYSNFYMSKADGETLEDFCTLFSFCKESEEQNHKETFENIKKRFEGSLAYRAPEVLQGSETSISSDLWALGCILYYMYTGRPPFHSDRPDELREMILHQDVPPLRQTVPSFCPPSEDFGNLLSRLLTKTPETRMRWPELLGHPFWREAIREEEYAEEEEERAEEENQNQEEVNSCEGLRSLSLRHTTIPDFLDPGDANGLPGSHITLHPRCEADLQTTGRRATRGGASRNEERGAERQAGAEDDLQLSGSQQLHSLQLNKSFKLEDMPALRPKCGVDDDDTDTIFLLSSCANLRKSCSITDSLNRTDETQAITGSDISCCAKALLYTDSEMIVTPVIDNPKIFKIPNGRFDPKTLCVPVHSVERLPSLSDEEWAVFLSQLSSALAEPSTSAHLSPSSPARSAAMAIRSRLNLLCYLCSVVWQKVVANRLINSTVLSLLNQQSRQSPNLDVRSKVLKLMGLLALHCTELEEESQSSVSEAVSTLTDLLRDNLKKSKIKRFVLPTLGEFLYLIASQEKKRGSPEGLWFVPAAAYTGLMRSLREGDDSVVHHMAAKAIENIVTVSGPSHPLVTVETGSALWYLYTHSPVEAVRVAAVSSLSRLTRLVPAVFLAVIDTCGPAAILEDVGGAGARVQQHLLTATAAALHSSRIHTHRFTQNKDLVLKVLRCLDAPSTVTRAKALLLLLLLVQDNTHTLLYCCQNRLVMYMERDLRKATPLKENPSQSAHLSQCLDLLIVYLSTTPAVILDNVLGALQGVIGRRHQSTAQSRQLKQTLPTLAIVLELLLSKVLRTQIVTEGFLVKMGSLLSITSVESNEKNLESALGAAACEQLIRTSLSVVEVLSQHHAVIRPHHRVVAEDIVPPLTTLVLSRNVEWTVSVLKVLSELSPVLLARGSDATGGDGQQDKKRMKMGQEGVQAEEMDDGGQVFSVIAGSLLPRYESLLGAAEPIPRYALKLLVSMTEHSRQMCSLIKHSRILPTVFEVIMANSSNVNCGIIQNAVALLCTLSGDTVLDLEPVNQQVLVEVVVSTLSEAALVYLDDEEEGRAGRKVSHLVLQGLLELLHNILRQTSAVVRSALQSQGLSCPAAETEAAEKLLRQNRPLSRLGSRLILMFSSENQEVWEESLHCVSLLVQLYGGDGDGCLSPPCLRSFERLLRARLQDDALRIGRTALRVVKRLVQTTERTDWFECSEGAELMNLLQDVSTSNRCHGDLVTLAAEILHSISSTSMGSSSNLKLS
ncbi:serine/threonine-protein kinase ULK4 isoform X1 [Nelusetta ayraudi]|uniref:serine/threonine-protein kinase ULK4 isoform X1 n=1 Tax=Nelusetta ayraudi TaxID=303726 RepID=UPI003F6FD0D0